MAVRPIDASELMAEIQACSRDSEQDKERSEDLVLGMPTLTPPNEWVTCEGCACEEYRRDTYPCNCCARNDETISDQYRPPEGEEDA